MFKTIVCLLALCIVGLSWNANAAPSVKMFSGDKAVVGDTKGVSGATKKQNNVTVAKVSKTPSSKANKSNFGGSSSIITAKPKSNSNITTTGTSSGLVNVKPGGTGSIGNGGNGNKTDSVIWRRLEALEAQSAKVITDVVEKKSGSYVRNVEIDGNNLLIEKTNLLNAPIRDINGNDLNNTAEIWIIK